MSVRSLALVAIQTITHILHDSTILFQVQPCGILWGPAEEAETTLGLELLESIGREGIRHVRWMNGGLRSVCGDLDRQGGVRNTRALFGIAHRLISREASRAVIRLS